MTVALGGHCAHDIIASGRGPGCVGCVRDILVPGGRLPPSSLASVHVCVPTRGGCFWPGPPLVVVASVLALLMDVRLEARLDPWQRLTDSVASSSLGLEARLIFLRHLGVLASFLSSTLSGLRCRFLASRIPAMVCWISSPNRAATARDSCEYNCRFRVVSTSSAMMASCFLLLAVWAFGSVGVKGSGNGRLSGSCLLPASGRPFGTG